MIQVSDRLVRVYFDTMERSYQEQPKLPVSDRVKLVLAEVLQEAKNGESDSRRR